MHCAGCAPDVVPTLCPLCSAHHIQGIQVYKGAPIIYSAGGMAPVLRTGSGGSRIHGCMCMPLPAGAVIASDAT